MKEMLLVSACLLGCACRYDGKSKQVIDGDVLSRLCSRYELISVCPEQLGGLPTPRTPSERQRDRVVMRDGTDVTAEFRLGAKKCLDTALRLGVKSALLKERSPSCGVNQIYDGSFSAVVISGGGVLAEFLSENGIKVYSEDDVELLLED